MRPAYLQLRPLRLAVSIAYTLSFTALLIYIASVLVNTSHNHGFVGFVGFCNFWFIIAIINVYRSFFGLPILTFPRKSARP